MLCYKNYIGLLLMFYLIRCCYGYRTMKDLVSMPVKLMPGMTVTVEVKTGTRRLIEFFLAPLLRYQQESVRER